MYCPLVKLLNSWKTHFWEDANKYAIFFFNTPLLLHIMNHKILAQQPLSVFV